MIYITKTFFSILFVGLFSELHSAELGHLYSNKVFQASSAETLNGTNAECGSAISNVYYFPVESNSPNGMINLYYTQHDAGRGLPISTTTYHDSLNHQQNVPRVDNFRKYPCPALMDDAVQSDCSITYKMTPAQESLSGYTAFDRGHMVPVNPYRFHEDAVDKTFYCVNIAPQEPFTNQNPWFTVEDRVHRRTTAGFVMTGLCNSNSADGPTLYGVQVPSCFWKMLCYKDGSQTRVVGFIGENSLFDRTDTAAQQRRTNDTVKARSQQAIIDRNGDGTEIAKAWRSASVNLLTRREANLAPNPTDCINAKTLPEDVADEWSRIMMADEFYEDLKY